MPPRGRVEAIACRPPADGARAVSDLLLGIDVGTSACKAAVVDADGAERAHGQAPTPWQRVAHRRRDRPPRAVRRGARGGARGARRRARGARVRGVGVTGMAETGVLLDAHGAPLAPAIAWHDARGGDGGRGARARDRRAARSSARPACPSPRCAARRSCAGSPSNAPGTRAARRWLNVGEWVVRGLGGDEVAELSLASRTGLLDLARRRRRSLDALAWTGLRDDLLPERVLAGTPAGRAGDALPGAAGAVLTVAGHDHLGAGVGRRGRGPGRRARLVRHSRGARPRRRAAARRAMRSSGWSRSGRASAGTWPTAARRSSTASGPASRYREVLDALGIGRRGPRRARRGRARHRSRRRARARARLPRARAPAAAPARGRRRPSASGAPRSTRPPRWSTASSPGSTRSPGRGAGSWSPAAGRATRPCSPPRRASGRSRRRPSSRPAAAAPRSSPAWPPACSTSADALPPIPAPAGRTA